MRIPTGWSVYVVHSPDRKISTKVSKVHKFLCHAYERSLITKQSRENKRAAHIALSVWGLRAPPAKEYWSSSYSERPPSLQSH